MGLWDRTVVTAAAATLAFMVATDAGVPAWRASPIGDATDLAFVTAVIAAKLTKARGEA